MPAAERARAVERDRGDDVLEAVGAQILEELLHAARLELEHARGLAGAEERVASALSSSGIFESRSACPRAADPAAR